MNNLLYTLSTVYLPIYYDINRGCPALFQACLVFIYPPILGDTIYRLSWPLPQLLQQLKVILDAVLACADNDFMDIWHFFRLGYCFIMISIRDLHLAVCAASSRTEGPIHPHTS